jgi:hypothetical protein
MQVEARPGGEPVTHLGCLCAAQLSTTRWTLRTGASRHNRSKKGTKEVRNQKPDARMIGIEAGGSADESNNHCHHRRRVSSSSNRIRSVTASGTARAGLVGIRYCAARAGAVTAAAQLYSKCRPRQKRGASTDNTCPAIPDRLAVQCPVCDNGTDLS